MLTVYGVAVLTFMMLMYALERRGPAFVAAFACGCALSSSYGFLAGTWPFGVVEAIWTVIALQRYRVRSARTARLTRGGVAGMSGYRWEEEPLRAGTHLLAWTACLLALAGLAAAAAVHTGCFHPPPPVTRPDPGTARGQYCRIIVPTHPWLSVIVGT
jgi:hypothetical protein